MTDLQAKMIRKIALDDYTPLNGAVPTKAEDATTWANTEIDDAEDRGVVRSLVNAGLAYHDGIGRDSVVGLTEAGFKAFQDLQN